ncbi:hypothetical protein BDY17DRAFT_299839 [Neohortaea acidophila]|uniref:1-phosphatidylinositol-4-phosphate 5-kinase n=1 Tax=Neohortaea acidophila TaxID=245834 RepID=A0A6A6PP55_9PEZI|nr:uncharacterized protein BDY17DRAFT_299839 [Neohortaea acidophila]KAF2481859.1 hypothetical protein BDY17DRAFT_299839 [Neohortaea acidophila]
MMMVTTVVQGQSATVQNGKAVNGTPTSPLLKPPTPANGPSHYPVTPLPSLQTNGPSLYPAPTMPATPTRRRTSLQAARRTVSLDYVPEDEDAQRWSEHIKAKRSSRRRADTEEEDRVLVGTKVDEGHENYVTAYNMLTGIRFTVSRTNAKPDRNLTDDDFTQKHKFSFDITGNELTPSARYDFKFKDYAPWVFRRLRASFGIDPAEYLMSLTSKYILSELGSPGKSGSFFYFSRDYKYIIKTIHRGEHKFLRRILKQYYEHVRSNPNTLLSQFYGLHRVKLPYGKKIHFVVMNNLFPPHRDIHGTYDLKGSTIGRLYDESELKSNPRATLKDLNWLNRGLKLEFGRQKQEIFITQLKKDVALLQQLKIMDYSLLVGIHDVQRGNEDNLRDKTLQVFQPGGDKHDEQQQTPTTPGVLTRTPSKIEHARRVRELRESVKKERPTPLDAATALMPEDDAMRRKGYFYREDGGFRATNADNHPGATIYYLGIIDCLTRYSTLKKAEHFWKGMGGHEGQISAIPPVRYGERFVKFISGLMKTPAEMPESEKREEVGADAAGNALSPRVLTTADSTGPPEQVLPAITETESSPGLDSAR